MKWYKLVYCLLLFILVQTGILFIIIFCPDHVHTLGNVRNILLFYCFNELGRSTEKLCCLFMFKEAMFPLL